MNSTARYFRLYSANPTSLRSPPVTVEIVITPGIPRHTVVGLAQGAVRESLDRIRAALSASGYSFPRGAVTVNLAPADTRKDGTAFDLPIALGILAADGQIDVGDFNSEHWLVMGELMLDARVRAVQGVMPAVMNAQSRGIDHALIPRGNLPESAAFPGLSVGAVSSMDQAVDVIEGKAGLVVHAEVAPRNPRFEGPDFASVIGQEECARTLALAAAGAHNVLMTGPPGCGKTLMARCMEGILPAWSRPLAMEATCVHSLRRPGLSLLERRPFRRPHHTVSAAGLLGGGTPLRPGEVSLAHGGVLFLDELPEFNPRVLEGLREPMEERKVTLSRAQGVEQYPSDFQLVGAMNPCPCGNADNGDGSCHCSERRRKLYRARLSGPLMDRIEIHLSVPRVNPLTHLGSSSRSSAEWLKKVESATRRLEEDSPQLDASVEAILVKAVAAMGVSMRAVNGIRRIARTIAALENEESVSKAHVAEAIRLGDQGRRAEVS